MHAEHNEQQPTAAMALSAWYGDPLDETRARDLLLRVRQAQQGTSGVTGPCPDCPLREMIAAFWLGYAVEPRYRNLVQIAPETRARALAELVYGQLLASCRLTGAIDHLGRGFRLAAPLLEPARYFAVLKRHEALAELTYGPTPAPALGLEALLREASVIRALRGRPRGSMHRPRDPADTVG